MIRMRTAAFIAATVIAGRMVSGQGASAPAPPMPPRLAELVKQLDDPEWDIRMEAATAIGLLGPVAKPAIPKLIEAFKDPVPAVRMKAIDALMFMGTTAAEAAPRIVPLLNDPDELVRVSAVIALPRITPDRASTVPLLKKALADKAWSVRRRAAMELVQLGEEVAAAIPVIREGLKDTIPSRRLEAIAILARASPRERTEMIAVVVAHLKDPDTDTRVEAVRRLSGLGTDAVPHLIAILQSEGEQREVQTAAIRALGRIGPDARAALPILQELRKRKGLWRLLSQRSIAAIEGKGPRPPEEIPEPVPPLTPPDAGPKAPSPPPR